MRTAAIFFSIYLLAIGSASACREIFATPEQQKIERLKEGVWAVTVPTDLFSVRDNPDYQQGVLSLKGDRQHPVSFENGEMKIEWLHEFSGDQVLLE